jgi:hypothetical protein
MVFGAGQRGSRASLAGVALALTVLCAGCATPGKRDPTGGEQARIDSSNVKTRDDIVQIVQFWNQPYWLQDSERVSGFKVTVYFVSGETEKGAFVPGNILVWAYELTPNARGGHERKLVHGWEFTEAEAMAMRVNKVAVGGYFYGFPLQWPRELSLEGKQVEIQFGYERVADKQVVLSSPRRFRVPIPIEYVPPDQNTEP